MSLFIFTQTILRFYAEIMFNLGFWHDTKWNSVPIFSSIQVKKKKKFEGGTISFFAVNQHLYTTFNKAV